MFFLLSKILFYVFMPLPMAFVLMVYAIYSKKLKRKKIAGILAISILFLGGNGFLVHEVIRVWEIKTPQPTQTYPIVVVLTGGMARISENGEFHASESADRFVQPALLYKKGLVKKILISGGEVIITGIRGDFLKEGQSTMEILENLGVKKEDIIWERTSKNTYENARNSAEILKKNYPNQEVLLCTSAFHLRRATACFEKQGIKTIPLVADIKSEPREFTFDKIIVPKEDNLQRTKWILKEWIGFVMYKLAGYV